MKEISKLFDPDKENQKLKLDDLLTNSINLNYWEENEEEFMEFIEKNFSIIKPGVVFFRDTFFFPVS